MFIFVFVYVFLICIMTHNSDCMRSCDLILINNELARIGRKAVVLTFNVFSRYLSRGTRNTTKILSQCSLCPCQNSNEAYPSTSQKREGSVTRTEENIWIEGKGSTKRKEIIEYVLSPNMIKKIE